MVGRWQKEEEGGSRERQAKEAQNKPNIAGRKRKRGGGGVAVVVSTLLPTRARRRGKTGWQGLIAG